MDDTRTTATVLRDAAGAYGLLAAVAGEQGKPALSKSYANLSRKAEARADYLEGLLAQYATWHGLEFMRLMNDAPAPTPASAPAAAGTGEGVYLGHCGRCDRCGWPCTSASDPVGCKPGDCSMRPLPAPRAHCQGCGAPYATFPATPTPLPGEPGKG